MGKQLMSAKDWPKLVGVSTLALVLAFALALQAVSGVLSKPSPELATKLFSANGQAAERLAFQTFKNGITDPAETQAAATAAAPQALAAYRADVLTPRALAILIMAETDDQARSEMLRVAAQMNRREASLQAQVIQDALANNNYDRSINALDQLLRVHPELREGFFPILGDALAQGETIPLFAEMLDGSSDWHERFLSYAITQPTLLPNVAVLRPQITVENENLDRRLIFGLAGLGDLTAAQEVLKAATGRNSTLASLGTLDWRADFAPFDWSFTDKTGLRAQLSRNKAELELFARPGRGGPLATRLLAAPDAPFSITIDHRVAQKEQARDVRLQLICSGETTPFLDERFGDSPQTFEINALGEGCDYVALALVGRAWSGRSPLNAAIRSIEITQ